MTLNQISREEVVKKHNEIFYYYLDPKMKLGLRPIVCSGTGIFTAGSLSIVEIEGRTIELVVYKYPQFGSGTLLLDQMLDYAIKVTQYDCDKRKPAFTKQFADPRAYAQAFAYYKSLSSEMF